MAGYSIMRSPWQGGFGSMILLRVEYPIISSDVQLTEIMLLAWLEKEKALSQWRLVLPDP
jgi:hypothetical protein